MKLTKEFYQITKVTMQKVLDALDNHTFSEDGEYNNEEVIEASELLEREIEGQQGDNNGM